jgi:ATP-dependent helicase/nuclease subunit A
MTQTAKQSATPIQAPNVPTPQQQAAIDAKSVSVVLSAGAGCGKTSVLTQRFLSHLEPGPNCADLTSLVAITFTERAAREMRERIRDECLERLRSATDERADHWLGIVRELDSARISTIHSFCSSLLRSHAVEAGLDPRFGLLDETLGASFLQQSVKAGLHALLAAADADVAELIFEFGLSRAQELLAMLVEQRYRIDFARWDQLTARDLAQRWDQQWHTVVVPRLLHDLAKAESARRTLELLRDHVPTNAVMQARCETLLEQLPLLANGDDPEHRLGMLRDNARVQGGGTKKDWESEDVYAEVKDALAALRSLIDKLLTQLDYDPEFLLRGAEIGLCALRATAKIGAWYDERKAREGLVDFDDLLLRARNLLRDYDDVRRRTQAGIALLMVDEFQDTDPIQDDIVRLLCGDRLLEGRLFVVGDAKQSIYRFRRAEPRVFHELRETIDGQTGASVEDAVRWAREGVAAAACALPRVPAGNRPAVSRWLAPASGTRELLRPERS